MRGSSCQGRNCRPGCAASEAGRQETDAAAGCCSLLWSCLSVDDHGHLGRAGHVLLVMSMSVGRTECACLSLASALGRTMGPERRRLTPQLRTTECSASGGERLLPWLCPLATAAAASQSRSSESLLMSHEVVAKHCWGPRRSAPAPARGRTLAPWTHTPSKVFHQQRRGCSGRRYGGAGCSCASWRLHRPD